jgi:hypothetical protein
MGDEGAFVFFHNLVFTLILCLSFACCWSWRCRVLTVPVTIMTDAHPQQYTCIH